MDDDGDRRKRPHDSPMLASLIHRVEDVISVIAPSEEEEDDYQNIKDNERGMTPPLFTNTTATTTTTAFAFDPSSSSSTSYSASAFIMDHHIDRRPTPMQLSCPTKTNMTLSSFSMSPSAAIYLRPSNDGALHQLTRDKIDEFLQPMLQSLIELDAEALLQSQRVEPGLGEGAQVFDGIRIQPIHTFITPPQPPDCVRYLHIAEVPDQYSIGIFVFPPNATIPLHDHPGMCVLSRVLYGEVSRVSLDLLPESEEVALLQQLQHHQLMDHDYNEEESNCNSNGNMQKTNTKSWFNHAITSQPPNSLLNMFPSEGMSCKPTTTSTPSNISSLSSSSTTKLTHRRLAVMNGVDRLVAPQVTSLYPYEGNLHEFTAGPQGAAVLDVLLPPYGQEDCTFYNTEPLSSSCGSTITEKERRPCWIVPTGQPEEFHCLSGRYLNIGNTK